MYDDILARGRRGTWLVATVGILSVSLVAAAATAVVLWLRDPGSTAVDGDGGPAEVGGPAEPTALPTDQRPEDAVTVAIPADLDWQDVAGVALPVSASKGPQDTSDGLATGFAHDPAGAVLAAVNIVVRINPQVGPDVFGPTLRHQVTGPDSAVLRARVESVYETLREQQGVAYGRPVGRLYATMLGFRVDRYTDTDVWLRILGEGPDGRGGSLQSAMRVQLSWTGTDWALVAPSDGDFGTAVEPVGSIDFYTPFMRS